MSYKILFKKSVVRDLKKMSRNQAEIILRKIERDLPEKADMSPSLTGKFTSMKKYRIGDYRIIYSIIGDTVLVLRVSHRRESYR